MLQHTDLTTAAREPMVGVGPSLMISGGECVLVVEMDARWKPTIEGERGIPMSFTIQNLTNLISFSVYIGIGNNLVSRPHAQTAQNNT